MNPKVFISHSSLDKDRFVTKFASRLRTEKGINAWYDLWELNVGDSLVDKIFNEGMKDSKAIIVILSINSINSSWVKEEINAGFINKISRNCKLLPIFIDDCEVPELFKSIKYIKIKDVNNYENEFIEIIKSIFGYYDKPALSDIPDFSRINPIKYFNLTNNDNFIFEKLCESLIENPKQTTISEKFKNVLKNSDINAEMLNESLLALESKGIIKTYSFADGSIYRFEIYSYAKMIYLKSKYNNIDETKRRIVNIILEKVPIDDNEIAKNINMPRLLIREILDGLNNAGLLNIVEPCDGGKIIIKYSPLLKRELIDN